MQQKKAVCPSTELRFNSESVAWLSSPLSTQRPGFDFFFSMHFWTVIISPDGNALGCFSMFTVALSATTPLTVFITKELSIITDLLVSFHPAHFLSLCWMTEWLLMVHLCCCLFDRQAEELCPRHWAAAPWWYGSSIGANRGSVPRGAVGPRARPGIPYRFEIIIPLHFRLLAHSCAIVLHHWPVRSYYSKKVKVPLHLCYSYCIIIIIFIIYCIWPHIMFNTQVDLNWLWFSNVTQIRFSLPT